MRYRTLGLAVTLGLMALAGCQKLNYEKSYSLDAHSTKPILFDPPRYNQNLTVTVTPTGGPVAAYLCKEDDHNKVENALMMDKAPADGLVMGSAKGTAAGETITFEASVPKETAFAVVLYNPGKKTDVSVKVVGR